VGKDSIGLPTKTKIGIWWIVFCSVAGLFASWEVIDHVYKGCDEWFIVGDFAKAIISLASLLSIISAVLLTGKTRGQWKAAVVLLVLVICCWTFAFLFFISPIIVESPSHEFHLFLTWFTYGIFLLLYLISLFLIILDIDRYWEMAKYRRVKRKIKPSTKETTSHPSGDL
jgi:hypothetical protein